jgi:capsular exopolysaccharide synthesis family protein
MTRELTRPEPVNNAPVTEPVLAFSHYFWLIGKWKWAILAWVVVCTSAAIALSYKLRPIYESTAKIAIDIRGNANVVGNDNAPADSASADQLFNTEMQLIQSDGVLRPVAKQFHLVEAVTPGKLPAGVGPGDAEVRIPGLTVTHPANSLLLDVSYRSPNAVTAAAVASAVAHSYLTHSLETRSEVSNEQSQFIEKQLGQLQRQMADSQAALASYENRLGVINPDEKTSILSGRLQQLNTEYTDAQNDRIRKEVEYMALQSGSAGAVGASPQAANLGKLEDEVNAAQQKMAAIKTVYGPHYAEYQRAENELNEVTRQYNAALSEAGQRMKVTYNESKSREDLLHADLMKSKAELDALSLENQSYQQLKDVAQQHKLLYNELFRRVQEARINGGYQGDSIRIADEAKPHLLPVFPNRFEFGFLGLFGSLISALILLLIADLNNKTLRDPVQTEMAIGVPVIGVLPRVRDFASLSPAVRSTCPSGSGLAKRKQEWFISGDFYNEQISTLLSVLLLKRRGVPLHSLAVTSAAPGEGKSSCISHMAAAHARKGYRTLLIDADLRRPSLQDYFQLESTVGLANAIVENKDLNDVRQSVPSIPTLDVITAGRCGEMPLAHVADKVEKMLAEARAEYDIVFIDAPPMLHLAEPMQIACMVDGVFLVTKAAETRRNAVASVVSILERLEVNVLGVVLNQVRETMSPDYQSYGAYHRKTLEMSAKPA